MDTPDLANDGPVTVLGAQQDHPRWRYRRLPWGASQRIG